jgi:hypothetical protein
VSRGKIPHRRQQNADGNHKHAAKTDCKIAPQQFEISLELAPHPSDFRSYGSDFRSYGSDFGLQLDPKAAISAFSSLRNPVISPVVASSAPDMASANASAVSPACFGEEPALSSLRASFSVSNGTAPMRWNLRCETAGVE